MSLVGPLQRSQRGSEIVDQNSNIKPQIWNVGKDKARGRKDAAIKRYVGGLNSHQFVKADGSVDLQ